jgi:hypothetical protein
MVATSSLLEARTALETASENHSVDDRSTEGSYNIPDQSDSVPFDDTPGHQSSHNLAHVEDQTSHMDTSSESLEPYGRGWILDILETEPALFEFINWAFGFGGLPSLQVIALGDFSYENRYALYNRRFCRHSWSISNSEKGTRQEDDKISAELPLSFHPMNPERRSDDELFDLIWEYKDVLAACPTDRIMETTYWASELALIT